MENASEKQVLPAYSCLITATHEGPRIEAHGGMTPDLLLAVLWQAIQVVSSQVIQQGFMRVIPVKDLKGENHPM